MEPGQEQPIEPRTEEAQGTPRGDAKHPLLILRDLLNKPLDMVQYEFKQEEDGSAEWKVRLPSRSEQQKQRIQAENAKALGQAPGATPLMEQQPTEVPQEEVMVEELGVEDAPKSLNASNNVKVVVAMTQEDVIGNLKTRYPQGFLKGMGLI